MQEQEKHGHKDLVRAFGLPAAVILFVSSIIGSGVYKKVAPMSLELESPKLVLLAWVLAGVVTLFGVLTTTEIGSMITESGGPYAYFKKYTAKFSRTITAGAASRSYSPRPLRPLRMCSRSQSMRW